MEPIVAAMVGTIWFGESLNAWQLIGITLVVAAVVSVRGKKSEVKATGE